MHGKPQLFFQYCFLENPKTLSIILDLIDPPFSVRYIIKMHSAD